MAGKEDWGKPAAWAITQNEKLWAAFDSIADRSVIVDWSLGDTYRTRMMEPADPTLFWVVGRNGGIARVGFVLAVRPTPRGYWKDASGTRHESPYSGQFFLPPLPNRRYIHRSALASDPRLTKCELLTTAAQSAPLCALSRRSGRRSQGCWSSSTAQTSTFGPLGRERGAGLAPARRSYGSRYSRARRIVRASMTAAPGLP